MIHFLLCSRLAALRRSLRKAWIIDAILPGLVKQESGARRVLVNVGSQLPGKRTIARNVVALDTRLLDRDEIPRFAREFLLQAFAVGVSPGLVARIFLEG